jgi:hypothetical protein
MSVNVLQRGTAVTGVTASQSRQLHGLVGIGSIGLAGAGARPSPAAARNIHDIPMTMPCARTGCHASTEKETRMATTDEIERRVEEADAARSERRSAAAKQVGELAPRRAAIAEQLSDIERELGDVLADSSDVMGLDEMARFTDVPAADLSRWLNGKKATRTRRKQSAGGASGAKNAASRGPSAGAPAADGQASTLHEPSGPRDSTVSPPARVTAEVR